MKKLLDKFGVGPGSGGFTMIELLVVIAVIGVLAVAVLSSINPVEQINKGRDTRVRSNAAQLLNAIDRFYAIHELYPWNDLTYGGGSDPDDTSPSLEFPGTGGPCVTETSGFCQIGGESYTKGDEEWLTGLSTTDEVKESFINQLENTKPTNATFVFKDAAGAGIDDSVYVCFQPSSKAFQQQAVDDCELRGDALPGGLGGGACPAGAYPVAYTSEMICLP